MHNDPDDKPERDLWGVACPHCSRRDCANVVPLREFLERLHGSR